MMKITAEQAKEYLNDIGYFEKPDMPDEEWVRVISFLVAYGFIKEIEFDSPVGHSIMAIVEDSFEDYMEWKAELPVDLEPPTT
jgi:hypothetical protein